MLTYAAQAQAPGPQLGKAPVEEVMRTMTLEEKAHLVVGMDFSRPSYGGHTAQSNGVIGRAASKASGAAGTTYAISRLDIPTLVLADGPAGGRVDSVRPG